MTTATVEKLTPFAKWYAKEENKIKLAKLRKQKYRDSSEYREKAKQNAAAQRAKLRHLRPGRPEKYAYTHTQVAECIGVSTTTLRLWRKHRYYPMPFEARGRLYFTLEQVALLEGIAKFFKDKGRRLRPDDLRTLESLVNYVHANWQ